MKKLFRFSVVLVIVVLTATTLFAGGNQAFASGAAADKNSSNIYIVRMADEPVVAYNGSVRGYRATAPGQGKKIDPTSTAVVQYAGYLDARHSAGRRAQAVRLSLFLQRLRRRAGCRPGFKNEPGARRAFGQRG